MKYSNIITHLSIASWNVQGLISKETNKIDDPNFIHEIQKHHIIALQETHTTSDMYINVPGYYTYQVSRPHVGRKAHGGIAILVKNELRAGVRFLSAETTDLVWVCLKKEFFHTARDVYVGAIYISPYNSSYTKRLEYNHFDVVEQEI
jgi:exonuclease III